MSCEPSNVAWRGGEQPQDGPGDDGSVCAGVCLICPSVLCLWPCHLPQGVCMMDWIADFLIHTSEEISDSQDVSDDDFVIELHAFASCNCPTPSIPDRQRWSKVHFILVPVEQHSKTPVFMPRLPFLLSSPCFIVCPLCQPRLRSARPAVSLRTIVKPNVKHFEVEPTVSLSRSPR